MVSQPEQLAKKELIRLGLKVCPENIDLVIRTSKTPQFPPGFEEITKNLKNPEILKKAMHKFGIKHIMHAEGPTLWDHIKLAIEKTSSLDIPEDVKKDLKIIMLFHDLGKTKVFNSPQNKERTEKNLKKGNFWQSMINHDKSAEAEIKKGLKANGLSEDKADIFLNLIKSHMCFLSFASKPAKIVKLFETFGKDEKEIKDFIYLLSLVFKIDNESTKQTKLVGEDLEFFVSPDELSAESLWGKYQKALDSVAQINKKNLYKKDK